MIRSRTVLVASLIGLSLAGIWLSDPESSDAETEMPSPAAHRQRAEGLRRAKVFTSSTFRGETFDFAADPNADVIDPHLTTCTFEPTEPSGTTPKFDCRLENGEKIKVKYGWTREILAEVAGTRLLTALGFPADRMSHVASVRCYGCVISPFHARKAVGTLGLRAAFDRHLDYRHSMTFADVAIERKLPGAAIETPTEKGWSFYELSSIDAARGGATRSEIDALRLVAVFLSHWDNKAENQRLLCEDDSVPCRKPLVMLHDLGSDFGPYKVDLDGWRSTSIWADPRSCTVSMKNLPYAGATFQDVKISDEGRRLLGERLSKFSPAQIETLFRVGGFSDVAGWTAAFQDKVRQIVNVPRCPTSSSASS